MRRYSVNRTYFDDIDSHEKAYWLGFLSADAHLFSGGGIVAGIQLELGERDLMQIERFRDALLSDAPIRRTTHGKYQEYRLRLCSADLAKALMRLGLTQNKAHNLPFPKIAESYFASYILGYFDGDGSITIEGGKKPRLQFVGGYGFLHSLADVLSKIGGVNKATIHKASGTYRVLYGGKNQVRSIRNWMYKDFELPMDRKKDKLMLV